MVRRIHHVGIVVERLKRAFGFYRDVLGLPVLREAELPDQGVRAALLAAGDSEVELLEPLHPDTGVGRFLARRGEGLHHLCFETPDVA
ncbi:MAG TPA: VOC family protein, partial [Methylomirabilota bacterium]|nr:VOC family protein [Methylomirabilota bacterium]